MAEKAKEAGGIPRPRIQSLSDLIFGLALSIGAISLLANRPASLPSLLASLLGFGWAFVVLALIWVRYTSVMSVLPVESGNMVAANMLLLFLVSIEPYLFNLIAMSYGPATGSLTSGDTTALYALDMGSMFIIIAYFTHLITMEKRDLISKDLLWKYRLMRNSVTFTATLFLVSILPPFWSFEILGLPARFYIWMGTFVVTLARRAMERRTSLHQPLNKHHPHDV